MQGQSSNSNIRCFKCGEPGHRAIDCRKPASKTGKNLLIEDETVEEINIGDLIFYDSNEEEILYGDGQDMFPRLLLTVVVARMWCQRMQLRSFC
jgi:hypothetical protein